MLPYEQHLLPPNASALERVLAASGQRFQEIPTPINKVKWPYDTTTPFIPFVGWEFSADLWRASWPDMKKRNVVASSIYWHKIKGTKAAIAGYCELVESKLLQAITPPAKSFASPAFSKEQREAWLSSLPQLKVYDLKERGQRGRLMFMGAPNFKAFVVGRFALQSEARFRLDRRATLTLDGTTTPVKIDGIGQQADRVRLFGTSRYGAFCDTARRGFMDLTTASERIISFTFAKTPPHGIRFPVRPGLKVISVLPDSVHQRGTRGRSIFCRGFLEGGSPWPTTAPLRVFYRVPIFDTTRLPPGRQSLLFAGRGRLGIQPHHAELQVSMPGRQPVRTMWKFVHGHLKSADRAKWQETFQAIRAAKRLSDRLVVDSKTYRPLRMGTPILLGGSYPLGRWTRS